MKYAWMSLVAGVVVVIVSAVQMMDILVLQAGLLAAAGGLTALFLNVKRLEAMAEGGKGPDNDGVLENRAA